MTGTEFHCFGGHKLSLSAQRDGAGYDQSQWTTWHLSASAQRRKHNGIACVARCTYVMTPQNRSYVRFRHLTSKPWIIQPHAIQTLYTTV